MTDSQRIQELHQDVKAILVVRLPAIEDRITKIETKHTVWGMLGGFIAGILGSVIAFSLNNNIRGR